MASEVANTVISKVTESVVDSVGRQIDYAWNCNDYIGKLNTEADKLKHAKRKVKRLVNEAKRGGQKIEPYVDEWLKDAEKFIEEADRFLQLEDRAKKKYCVGLCRPWITRHQMGRKAKKEMLPAAKKLNRNREVSADRVSYRDGPKSIGRVEGYENFESRMSAMKDIMELLADPKFYKIGVYGISGVGKTTLVREIARQAKEKNLFEEVAMATVFPDRNMKEIQGEEIMKKMPNLTRIQEEIADGLDFAFHSQVERGKADELRDRLQDANKKLVILDNIWAGLELADVGIPSDYCGCKILMVSTSENILSSVMDSKKNIQLGILSSDDAQNWFKKMVGLDDVSKNPALEEYAIQIADRCAGLPNLLITAAKRLKDKGDLTEWKETLKQLSGFDKKDIHADVDLALQLSYNLLGGDEIRSLFLLCGQLRPHAIYVEDLLIYAMGLGLFEKRNTIEDTRFKLLKFISDLKASCLLLEDKIPGTLKMHDIVHEFAVSVARADRHVFTVASDTSCPAWSEMEELERYTTITLPYCEIPELPEVLECPYLESFLLFSKDPSLKIPDNFFKKMKKLKVLHLAKIRFSALPSSLVCLENLRTLCLDQCGLGDITIVGKLKTLRVLSFDGCDIAQLPGEIKKLTELQLLNLKNCPRLVIPPDILSRLTQLEELNMENSFLQWEDDGQKNQGKNASLDELKHLSNLRTLDVHITNAKMLPKGSFFEKLERFRIFIGDGFKWAGEYKTPRTLKLKLNSRNELEKGVKALLKRTEDLYLKDLKGIRSSLYELDGQGFPQLKHLHVKNSHEIQYVINATGMGRCSAFTRLESLFLSNLKNLEKICCGELLLDSFSNLKVLKVGSCGGLKNLFSSSMARALVRLEDVRVNDCNIMEEVVTEGTDYDTGRDEAIKFAQLYVLTLESLPQFKSFCSSRRAPSLTETGQDFPATDPQSKETASENDTDDAIPLCGSFFHSKVKAPSSSKGEQKQPTVAKAPMPLFNEKVDFPNLKELKLSSINNDMIWRNQLSGNSSCVPNLTSLIVDGCNSFKFLLSSSMVEGLVYLKKLGISNCKTMEKIIHSEESVGERKSEMQVRQLESLHLKDLPNLAEFCRTDLLECPALKTLRIDNCSKLSTFISNSSRTDQAAYSEAEIVNSALFDEKVAFTRLEGLTILNMNSLKKIWHSKLRENSFSKLKRLELGKMEELRNVFPSNYIVTQFKNVEFLSMDDCKLLEKVFDLQESTIVKGIDGMVGSRLRRLKINSLRNLKCIWNNDAQRILSFRNLQTLSVSECPNLKSLFPAYIARDLRKLSLLKIRDCGIEEIISKEEGLQTVPPEFEFPLLTWLRLWKLPALKRLYSGNHISEFPKLKFLFVYECDEIEIFTSKSQCVEEASSEDQLESITQQPLFSAEIIPNLEELPLNCKDVITVWGGHITKDLYPNAKILRLQCFHNQSKQFPFDLIRRFNNLESLFVANSCFKEIFASDDLIDEENQGKIFSQIRKLHLILLYNLKQIKLDHVLTNLENLEIWDCQSLINLAPSSASFKNLAILIVKNCDNLVNLVTFPTAKSLQQLRRMAIENCKMMTEVLANGGEDGSNEIIFHTLESLTLDCLTSLVSFCPVHWTLKFPSLEALTVTHCPKMSAFSLGHLEVPKLRKVQTVVGKWDLQDDLNTTIKKLYEQLGYGGVKSKPSATRQLTLDFGDAKAKQGETAAVAGGQPLEDLHVTKNPDVDQVLPAKVETTMVEEQGLKSSLTEHDEINQVPPTDPSAISSYKPDPTHCDNSQIFVHNETHVSLQIQKHHQMTDGKHHQITDENGSTIPVSTSASPTEITPSNELTSGTASIPASEMPSAGQLSNQTSHSPANFESLFASMQDLLKPSSELCPQQASNSITHAELHESNSASFQNYEFSMDMLKKTLKKNLTEAARSADALQLLISLKNLKNCPRLNSEQLKIIQYYIENISIVWWPTTLLSCIKLK